jgi:hypothetical protein
MVALFRMNDRYSMTARDKSFHQVRQGHGDTVYLGRIGLSNDADMFRTRGGVLGMKFTRAHY